MSLLPESGRPPARDSSLRGVSARISGGANPKSSTGRIDVFTRLITDYAPSFDRIEPGYRGPLYAEICPQTFPVLVRKGSRLNQLRIRHGSPSFGDAALRRLHEQSPLVDGEPNIDDGLALSIDLKGGAMPASASAIAPRSTPA